MCENTKLLKFDSSFCIVKLDSYRLLVKIVVFAVKLCIQNNTDILISKMCMYTSFLKQTLYTRSVAEGFSKH